MRLTLLAVALSTLCLSTTATVARADEGMWMPSQLPDIAKSMRERGFRGDPKQMANLATAPMNAVVKVGGGTGAFVSDQGLVLTNHHVAFGVIQYNSKPEHDYIAKGYIAADRSGELPANPDFRVLVTTDFDNVTAQVLKGTAGLKGKAYNDAVERASKALVSACEATAGYRCQVVSMYYGAEFYRVRQLELRDVRLVYAPPSDIGNYGGETDNFMWPRHAGDFTILRAYVGKDGKPADYSPDNVPYVPPSHLQISTRNVKEGDYAMLAGYPGITYRHRTAAEFAQQMDWQLPSRVALFDGMIRTIETATKGNADATVAYASQMRSLKNNLKRAQGELEGMQRSNAATVRAQDEQAMLAWLRGGKTGALDVAATLGGIQELQQGLATAGALRERDQLLSTIVGQTQLFRSAVELQRRALERQRPDAERRSGFQERDEKLILGRLQQVQRRYTPAVEQALLLDLVRQYQALPAAQHVAEWDAVFGTDPAQTADRIAALYAGSTLQDESRRVGWLHANARALTAADDTLLKAAALLVPAMVRLDDERDTRDGESLRLRPTYMQALIAYRKSQGRAVYPDANSTLRVSFGRIQALSPRDGVDYRPLTTVAGIAEKHTGSDPFNAPQPLLDAIRKGDFGTTAEPSLKTQTVNFLTNLDTTGGNSGSPVLDADGKLIGLNFDSNWEAVSASWAFDPRYKRAIHVDMRYMRWLMAKVYPAPHLLRELNLPAQ